MKNLLHWLKVVLTVGIIGGMVVALTLEMVGRFKYGPDAVLVSLVSAALTMLIILIEGIVRHAIVSAVIKELFFGTVFVLLLVGAFGAFVAGLVDMFRWSGDETVGALRVGGFIVAGFALLLASLWVKTRKLKPF